MVVHVLCSLYNSCLCYDVDRFGRGNIWEDEEHMTTIYDVAKAAGVSHSTVSRVVNGAKYVSDETRNRVLKAIEELKYYPNELARGLVNRKTKTVALIVADVTNPFFTTVARGVEDMAIKDGYSVILCNTDEDVEKEKIYIDLVLRKQMEGVLLASAARDARHLKPLTVAGVPIVLLDRRLRALRTDIVRADGFTGAKEATLYLIKRGHQRVALFSGPLYVDSMQERYRGYREALESSGIPHDSSLVLEGELRFETGFALAKQAMSMDSPPTAILCTNNFIGLGALTALKELGKRIPEDVALITFDDIEVYSRAFPFLTTVTQPAYTFGRLAMELLLQRMSGKAESERPKEIVLATELVIRQSA